VFEPPLKAQVSPDSERIIRKIPLAAIVVEAGRSVDKNNVQTLAASFRQVGQTSAILVVREENRVFRVLSGNNRVMAAGEVGWDRIDAVVLDCTGSGILRTETVIEGGPTFPRIPDISSRTIGFPGYWS
jgi:ParB-like chromosome segregation protein Spo0J